MFDPVIVASIQHTIQFWVFEQSYKRRGTTNQFIYLPILAHSLHYWACWKAINHTFQMNP
jgi:hypothetical protein